MADSDWLEEHAGRSCGLSYPTTSLFAFVPITKMDPGQLISPENDGSIGIFLQGVTVFPIRHWSGSFNYKKRASIGKAAYFAVCRSTKDPFSWCEDKTIIFINVKIKFEATDDEYNPPIFAEVAVPSDWTLYTYLKVVRVATAGDKGILYIDQKPLFDSNYYDVTGVSVLFDEDQGAIANMLALSPFPKLDPKDQNVFFKAPPFLV